MDHIIKLIFGKYLSFHLLPKAEKKKSEHQRLEGYQELLAELEDMQKQLSEYIKLCFDCLYFLQVEPNKVNFGFYPCPLPHQIDAEFVSECYKKTRLHLSSDQRQAVKRIPSDISELNEIIKKFSYEQPLETINNRTILKRVVELACLIVFDVNKLRLEESRYKIPSKSDYIGKTRQVLDSLGFSSDQVDASKIDLTDLMVEPTHCA